MATPLFVHGTLKKGGPSSGTRRSYQKASLAKTLYDLGDYPGMFRNCSQRRVPGELFELDESKRASILRRLDEYEGPEFVRQRGFVTQRDGKRRLAWFYVLQKQPDQSRIIPSGRYRLRRRAA